MSNNESPRVSASIVAPEVDWQPAETAPKETEILMAWEDGHLQIVYLTNEPSFWFENEPTHWAPLPAGPSVAAPASTVAPQQSVIHWQLRIGVEETMCGVSVESEEGIRVSLLPDKATCNACEAAVWGYQCGRADERSDAAPASPAALGEQSNASRSVLDEIESALLSINNGVSPQVAVGQVFAIINSERAKLNAAPAALRDDADRLSASAGSERLGSQEDKPVKNYDDFRAGMLRAAEMARNEFKRAPEAAKGHDCVYMGGYEDACDHLSVAIAQAAVIDSVRMAGPQPDWQYHISLLFSDGIEDTTLLKIFQVVEHELRAATTPPSTLARKAAEEIASWLFANIFHPSRQGGISESQESEIAAIIERCFAAESEKEK